MGTVIISDSRGRGLQELLDGQGVGRYVEVLMQEGAGSELAVLRSMDAVRRIKPGYVILMTGICDLTYRHGGTGRICLRQLRVKDGIDRVMEAYVAARELLDTMGVVRVSLATLTGIDLSDYHNKMRIGMNEAQYREYERSVKQRDDTQGLLDQMILTINQRITENNSRCRVPTVWLAGAVHTYYRKRTYNYYRRLRDGCHPDESTRRVWVRRLRRAIVREEAGSD